MSLFDGLEPEPDELVTVKQPTPTEVMPPSFALPKPIKWMPDERVREALNMVAHECNELTIVGGGATALMSADTKIGALRNAIKMAEEHFKEPTAEANREHKRLTSMIADWIKYPLAVVAKKNREIYDEQTRLRRIEDEARRIAQAEADRIARESLAAAAKDAEKANAPKDLVREMKQAAKTIQAPPVSSPAPAPELAHTSVGEKWKSRLVGTEQGADPHPAIKDLTQAQRDSVMKLCADIGRGAAPVACLKELDWVYLDRRAVSEKTTMALAGLEAFDEGGTRAKPGKRS